jgi:hypothetical protein
MSGGAAAARVGAAISAVAWVLVISACAARERPADTAASVREAASVATPEKGDERSVVQASGCRRPTSAAWEPAPMGAARFVVNAATHGMTARVRWMLSPDSSALLVVEDPAGVENEAVPNGVLFATERTGRVWRMDSVWSVAPSPDWRQLALGRGVVLGGGREQRVAPERWRGAAVRLRALAGDHPALDADSLRAHAYPVSGMAVVEGAAATFVADVAADAQTPSLRFVALDGWTVRWSCDGADLLVGDRPLRVQDDAPSAGERRVSLYGAVAGNASAADSARWTSGPTLDVSVPVSLSDSTSLVVRGRTIEGRAGRIVVREQSPAGRDALHDVGPGVPLAATRGGHFILAVARRPNARPHESPDQAVVYRVP